VKGGSVKHRYVDIEVSMDKDQGIDLSVASSDSEVGRGVGPFEERETPCGDVLRWGRWLTKSKATYRAITYGLGGEGGPSLPQLRVVWTIASTALTSDAGKVNILVSGGAYHINYDIDPVDRSLVISSNFGDRFVIGISVTAIDSSGKTLSAASTFEAEGFYEGYSPEDWEKLIGCELKFLMSIRFGLKDLVVPDSPDPFPDPIRPDMRDIRLHQLARRVADLNPALGLGLKSIAELRSVHRLQRLKGMR
jgi:hypothetical protein